MSSSHYAFSQQFHHHTVHSHSHHGGRSRRQTRASGNHHHQQAQTKQHLRALRLAEKAEEERQLLFRREFEAARSFDYEDDDMFCPFNLMTEDDLQSMSSGSDRSSMSSGSPDHSPITQQVQPAQTFLLPPTSISHNFQNNQNKIHQPLAQRIGAKAIPIVDPSTRAVASPPPSVSPGRQFAHAQRFVPRQAW